MPAKPVAVDAIPPHDQTIKTAMRNVALGEATPGQQRAVMRFLTGELGAAVTRPPAGLSEHDSGFLSGRRWVGIVALEIASVPLFRAEKEENE